MYVRASWGAAVLRPYMFRDRPKFYDRPEFAIVRSFAILRNFGMVRNFVCFDRVGHQWSTIFVKGAT